MAGPNQTPWFSGCQRDCVSCASVCHCKKSFQPLTCIAQLWKESSALQKSDLSFPRTQLCFRYATWFCGNITPASRLKVRFIHVANEEAAKTQLHCTGAAMWVIFVIPVMFSYLHQSALCSCGTIVKWSSKISIWLLLLKSSHEHMTKQCSVWMRIPQLAFALLGPGTEGSIAKSVGHWT